MVAADARTAITFALSPGNSHDAPEGRELLRDLGSFPGMPVIMDRAYEGYETRQLVLALDMVPVVPPKSNRVNPWRYDRALYRKRNEIERRFRRLKGYRRIFSASKNWTASSSRSSASLSSSKPSDSVNAPKHQQTTELLGHLEIRFGERVSRCRRGHNFSWLPQVASF